MGVSENSDHIQIKIKMPNYSQAPPVSSKAQNQDLQVIDVFCTFKVEISAILNNFQFLVNWGSFYWTEAGVSKTNEHIPIKIKMQTPSQRHSAFAKAPNEDLKNMDALCIFKIQIESKN